MHPARNRQQEQLERESSGRHSAIVGALNSYAHRQLRTDPFFAQSGAALRRARVSNAHHSVLHDARVQIPPYQFQQKVAGIQRAIQAAGATFWYLPPDSPDLNPIELCFAKLTALVRTARCRSPETLWPFLGECLAHFSPDECRHYVRHGGYAAATRS